MTTCRTACQLLLLMLAMMLVGSPTLFAQICGENEPAFPVPECRDGQNGDEVACTASNAVRLWPPGFRPGRPDQQLPAIRDSTDYIENTIPGQQFGHELFLSLDIVGDYLYVAYNAGIQVWDVAGSNAEDPDQIFFRDGWRGQFLSYPPPGESDGFTDDIAVIDPAGGNQDVLIAVAGRDGSGVNFWEHTLSPPALNQLYQDLGDQSTEVEIVEFDGFVFGLAANFDGVYVYNVTRAQALAAPCLDDRDQPSSPCPTVYRGELGDMDGGGYLAAIERGGTLYVAASDGKGNISQPFPFEIWGTDDLENPGNADLKFSGLASNVRGPEFFVTGGTYYLSLLEAVGQGYVLKIFDVDHCLDNDGCTSLGTPVWSRPVAPTNAGAHFLTYSESDGTPYLYYGFAASLQEGSKLEQLLDLSTLGTTNQLTEITDGGGSYVDDCNGLMVDYWGDYYGSNDHGLRNLAPRIGKFRGPYFYRAAVGVLDVHVITTPTCVVTVGGPANGCPGIASTFEVTALNCPNPTSPYEWTAGGGGQVSGSGLQEMVDITWTSAGTKTVTVSNPDFGDPATTTIVIDDPQNLGFDSPPTYVGFPDPVGVNRQVQFSVETMAATSWQWDFGDGTTSNEQNPTHVYTALGTYDVTVTITNCLDESITSDPFQVEVVIPDDPLEVVEFRAQCPFGICDFCTGDTVTFNQSFGGDPTSFEYDWDGNGSFEQTSSTPVLTHRYTTVSLGFRPKVRISAGTEQVTFTHVSALNVVSCGPPPSPSITVTGPSSLPENTNGTFQASASNCSPSSNGWTWTTSGGVIQGSSSVSQVQIQWSTSGNKTVTARNSACGNATGSKLVTVLPGSFSVTQFQARCLLGVCDFCIGETVIFDQSFNGTPITYEYDWDGNGTYEQSSSTPVAGHVYSAERLGFFPKIRIRAGAQQDVFTHQQALNVIDCGTTPDISVSGPTAPATGQRGTYTATVSDCTADPGGWSWTASGGGGFEGSNNTNPVTIFWNTPGSKTVRATNTGCESAQGTLTVEVSEPPGPTDMLILPYFKVDMTDPNNLTTFFSVRNGSDTPVRVEYAYFTADEDQFPFITENLILVPHRTRVVNVGNIANLPVDSDGMARGWGLFTVVEPLLGERVLGGDYFRLDRTNDFASGNTLLTTSAPDLCSSWQMRFFNGGIFDGGTDFSFYAPGNPGDGEPILSGDIYDENGSFIRQIDLLNSEVAFEINSLELNLGTEFGSIEWQFRDGFAGHISAILRASGKFSVGLPAFCRDQ